MSKSFVQALISPGSAINKKQKLPKFQESEKITFLQNVSFQFFRRD